MPFLGRKTLFDVVDKAFSGPVPIGRAADLFSALNGPVAADSENESRPPASDWPRFASYTEIIIRIGLQVARALGEAHRQGILHCDVKPSNVLLTDAGEARLLDFNLALRRGGAAEQVGGTLPYMAPEQLRAADSSAAPEARRLDQRTDIYCLGVTLFELLYGRLPFGPPAMHMARDQGARHLLEKQRCGVVIPRNSGSAVDKSVAAIVVRCLEFDPEHRPQSMEELASLLAAQLTVPKFVRRRVSTHRRLAGILAACVCTCIIAVVTGLALREPYPIREFHAAHACYQRGEFPAAIQHCTAAIEADAELNDARLLRACAYYRQKDFVSSYGEFHRLSQLDDDWRPIAGMAHSLAAMDGNVRLAGALYQKAIEQGGNSPALLNNLGNCLADQGRVPDGVKYLEQACSLDPQLGVAWHNLSRIELRRAISEHRVPEMRFIEKALALEPETTELVLNVARLHAVYSRYSPDAAERTIHCDEMIKRLELAFDCGMQAEDASGVLALVGNLKSNDRTHALTTRPPTGLAYTFAERLADPFPDMLAPRAPEPAKIGQRHDLTRASSIDR
jgi:Tfp pilus assembly protein PilF